jgi:hypothetical protein
MCRYRSNHGRRRHVLVSDQASKWRPLTKLRGKTPGHQVRLLSYLSPYGKDGDFAVRQIEVVLENWSWHHGRDDHECCDHARGSQPFVP